MQELTQFYPVLAALPLIGCVGMLALVLLCERMPGFAQFVKYGTNGVIATYVQTGIFYALAATCLGCLRADDWAVKYLGLTPSDVGDAVRSVRFAVATSVGFVIANVVCWLMNRWCVFKPGKFRWHVELAMFFATSTVATLVALALSSALIGVFGLMTSVAVLVEVIVSFMVNFFVRKFYIFRG